LSVEKRGYSRCVLCSREHYAMTMVRVEFVDDGKGPLELCGHNEDGTYKYKRLPNVVVASSHASPGVYLCVDCVRAVKRMPFSEIDRLTIPF